MSQFCSWNALLSSQKRKNVLASISDFQIDADSCGIGQNLVLQKLNLQKNWLSGRKHG